MDKSRVYSRDIVTFRILIIFDRRFGGEVTVRAEEQKENINYKWF